MVEFFLGIALAILLGALVLQYQKYVNIKFLLNRTNEINDRMIEISEELSRFENINVLYMKLLHETIDLIEGAECGSILIYNKEKDFMEYKACMGFNEKILKKVRLKKEELFLYETTKLKTPDIIVNPLLYDKNNLSKGNFEDLLSTKALEIKTSLSAPLYIGGEFYGMINVDSKTSVDAFKKNDIKLITYIARELEIAIKNANLMNELVDALKTDKLTNIFNRRYFEEVMNKMLVINRNASKRFTIVMIDLDDFKEINDNCGHKAGDDVLVKFAKVLNNNIREGDMAVRYAGDEFILFLNNVDENGAKVVVSRIRESLRECSFSTKGLEFSAGICEYKDSMSLDKIITLADDEMYREKRNKKGSCNR